MLKTSLPCALLIAATSFAIPCLAQEDGPKTPLAEQMQGISKDFRSLRKVVADPAQKAAALDLVKDMEAHATKAREFEPAKTKDIPAADKDQFIADYKKQMDGFLADFKKLEADVDSGDSKDATAVMDKLQMDKREGHKKFNAEAGGHGGPGGSLGGTGGPGGPAPAAPKQ